MSNYNSIKSIFQAKSYQTQMFFGFDINKLKPMTILINYLFNSLDLSCFNQHYKSDKITGGRPNMDCKILLKLFTLATYDNISFREIVNQISKVDSDYSYLAHDRGFSTSRSSISRFLDVLDLYINDIFEQTVEFFKTELELCFDDLYCDGTVFEAHNNRHKIIRDENIKKSNKKWSGVLNDPNSTIEEKNKAEAKLAENIIKMKKLALLERSSYGVTDEDSALLKDKSGSFIAGYNVQFVEDSSYGLVIYGYISNYGNDCKAFLKMVDGLIETTKPSTITMDAGYGTKDILMKLNEHKVTATTKPYKTPKADGSINIYDFILSEDSLFLTCPEGKSLKNTSKKTEGEVSFLANNCEGCHRFIECNKLKKRKSFRVNLEEFRVIQLARLSTKTEVGKAKYSQRSNLAESPQGYMKYYLQGKKFKMDGLKRNNTVIKIYSILYNLTRYNTIKFGEKKQRQLVPK